MGGKKYGAQRNRKAGKRGGGRPNQDAMVIPRPLQLDNVGFVHAVTMRFVTTGTVALAITYKGLLDAILNCATATVGYQMFDLVRVRGIEMWCYNPSGVTTLSLAYVGRTAGHVGDDRAHTAQSMGIEPAYLKAIPSRKALCGEFQADSTDTVFNIYCPIATTMDLHVVYRSAMEGAAPIQVANALVAGQPGLTYYRGIDNAAVATSKFTPVGTVQII